jgi:hypothetical protein
VQLKDINEAANGSRSFLLRVAAGLTVLIGLVFFISLRSSNGSPTDPSTTSTSTTSPIGFAELAPSTSTGPAGSAPTVVGTLPTEAIPDKGLQTPQAAARNLWDSWRDRDRPRALLYASPASVDRLFEWNWVPQIRQAGCTPLEAKWLCRFEGPKQRWDASVDGDVTTGYRVTSIRVGDPAGDLLQPAELPSVTNTLPSVTNPDGSPANMGPSLPSGVTLPTTVAPSTVVDTSVSTVAGGVTGDVNGEVTASTKRTRASSTKKRRTSTVPPTAVKQEAPATEAPPATQPKKPEPTAPKPADPPAVESSTGPVPVQGGTTPVPITP